MYSLYAIVFGFIIDLFLGDPHRLVHPVVLIGKLIDFLDKKLRSVFPKTPKGEKTAGLVLWILTVVVSTGIPILILVICHRISPWLRLAVESVMCWQILAVRSLKTEAMKVYDALKTGDLEKSRKAVSMIVGRDTDRLDDTGITKATVETVAENSADGSTAPLFYMLFGGAAAGFLYKSVNTMDSMLGYMEPPYKNIGLVPAKMDDVFNFIPSRVCAILMLAAGALLRMRVRNGWKIFKRDRFNHDSPNSAQTESVCAGLLGVQLSGDAWYHGTLHKKQFIGDPIRPIEHRDIIRACDLHFITALFSFLLCIILRIGLLMILPL